MLNRATTAKIIVFVGKGGENIVWKNDAESETDQIEREKNSKEYEWAAWVSGSGFVDRNYGDVLPLLRDHNWWTGAGWAELFGSCRDRRAAVGMEFYARFAHNIVARRVVVHADEIQERLEQKDLVVTRVALFAEKGALEATIFLRRAGVPAFAFARTGFSRQASSADCVLVQVLALHSSVSRTCTFTTEWFTKDSQRDHWVNFRGCEGSPRGTPFITPKSSKECLGDYF